MRRVVLLACLVSCADTRADDWPVSRGPSREPAPYKYDPALWKTVPAEFLDDAPSCILYAGSTHLVELDGTVESVTHDVTRLNSRRSIEKLGEYRGISFNPAHEKLTLNEARVHKANGKTVALAPSGAHLRDVPTDYQTYSPEKQLVLSFPSLEVGDAIEVKWTVRGRHPEHGGQFFHRYSFGDSESPIVLDEFKVRIPSEKSLKYATVNGKMDPFITSRAGQRLYQWSARNLHRPPRDEDRPSREESRLQVLCSTFASWEEVGEWKRRLRKDCWECTKEVREVVEKVTREVESPEGRAKMLTLWVRQNIRYIAAGARHDYTPHKPGDVVAGRRGDCKDTSQLLAVMLKEAGIPSALVTLGTQDDGQVIEAVPSPWGTHGILLVTIDGKDHWIDTTVTQAPWDFLPLSCRNRLCYVTDDTKIWLKRTPGATAKDNEYTQTTWVTVGADGSSRCVREAVYSGLAAVNRRDRWRDVPTGEQRRLIAAELQDSNSQAKLMRFSIPEGGLRVTEQPVRAGMEFVVPGHFANKDREASFTDARVWAHLLAYNLDHDRKVPLDLGAPVSSSHVYYVSTPAGNEFAGLPKSRAVQSAWGSFSRKVEWVGEGYRTIKIAFTFEIRRQRVELAEFDAFRQFHRDVNDGYRVWLSLEKSTKLGHAADLEAILAVVPEDGAAAADLARIYLHHDRYDDARRVLKRSRHYRPGDRALLELSVRAAANRDEAERLQMELVERFPGDSSQAIALAALMIDRGKHDRATEILELMVKGAPPAARSLASYHLARSQLLRNRPAEALKHLDDAEKTADGKTGQLAVVMLRGRVLEAMGRRPEAIKAFEKAHQLDPKAEDALLAIIEAGLEGGDRVAVGDAWRRYAALVGDRYEGLLHAAELALRLDRLDDAAELAGRARDQKFHESTQRILGLVHLKRGEWDRAIYHLDRAERTPVVFEGLIRAYLAVGNLRLAEAETLRAGLVLESSPSLKAAREHVLSLFERRKAMLEAVKAEGEERSQWITCIDYYLCADEARGEGRPAAQVEQLLTKAEEEGCELGEIHALKALLLLERGRLRDAQELADRAVTLSPADGRGWYVRGRVRLERGSEGAVGDLEQAAKRSGRRDPAVLRALAEARWVANQREQALSDLREAIQLRPGDRELAALLNRWQGKGAN